MRNPTYHYKIYLYYFFKIHSETNYPNERRGHMKAEKKQSRKIFSLLDTDIICKHKDDVLPQFDEILFHNHDGYEIFLFLSGNADYYIESSGKKLERGDLILSPVYSFHCSRADARIKYERIFINIRENKLSELSSNGVDLSSCFNNSSTTDINLIRLNEAEIDEFIRLSDSLEKSLDESSYGSDLLSDSLLIQIMIMVNRMFLKNESLPYTGIMPDIIRNVINYINEHTSDNITVSGLGEMYHHNPDYLSRIFKSFTGIPLQHFILIKKITLAQHLLRKGHTPLSACYNSGFNNYSNFSRSFSKIVGTSPKKYQKR